MRFDETATPHQMKDEDKWFGFTKKQIGQILVLLTIHIAIWFVARTFNASVFGNIMLGIYALVAVVLIKLPIPEDMYLYGADKPLFLWVFIYVRRRIRKTGIKYSNTVNEEVIRDEH